MTTIRRAQEMVAEFQARHHGNGRASLTAEGTGAETRELTLRACVLRGAAKLLMPWTNGSRGLRAQLLVEELSELLAAMAERDEAALLDALADLLYVTLGCAETFDLPLQEAFEEAHRSNMTKAVQADRSARVLDKGPNYRPPDMARVLREHRAKRDFQENCEQARALRDIERG